MIFLASFNTVSHSLNQLFFTPRGTPNEVRINGFTGGSTKDPSSLSDIANDIANNDGIADEWQALSQEDKAEYYFKYEALCR